MRVQSAESKEASDKKLERITTKGSKRGTRLLFTGEKVNKKQKNTGETAMTRGK